jgi:tetratricopeptide (TPR) repeat protein
MEDEFKKRLENARQNVSQARVSGYKLMLADSLKALANIERRPPRLRETALKTYAEAAQLFRELSLPLDEAWVLRHMGIIQEYAERLHEAEIYYDQALSLHRANAQENTLDYANAVRYPAVVKNRLGKREESRVLWEEAANRYEDVGASVGVAEAAAWLTIFAVKCKNIDLAKKWFAKAKDAAERANEDHTFKFIEEVQKRLEDAEI